MRTYFLVALLAIVQFSFAQTHPQEHKLSPEKWKSVKANELQEVKAMACSPATAIREVSWNSVRTLVKSNGAMWNNQSVGRGVYQVPKDQSTSVFYAGALWMGGRSPDQQLKLAGLIYEFNGTDFWPGPLTQVSAEVSGETCSQYDRFFTSYKQDAELHRSYFECLNNADCDVAEDFPNGYSYPSYFDNWPALGDVQQGQDFYLAPFYDFDGDEFYDPASGDYPWFDFLQEIDCADRQRTDPVPLFGDENHYYIFNDNGNIHTETQGQPIGMEVRAQAFSFATNDEVNNMTFYNYTLINQGTQTLTETYFGAFIDPDLGGHTDDYVGCDVQRGLGYAYNGNAFDAPSALSPGWAENPPAVGVDFFEGPYQDNDGVDNPLTEEFEANQFDIAFDNGGIPYKGIGIGYGDGVIDNERFGMRKFVYYTTTPGPNGTPENATEYYNYLRGFWKNGQRMSYGGNALTPTTGADLNQPTDYMFPGDSDIYGWATQGNIQEPWTEESSDNPPGDRRFIQSAGPFTLEPGDFNNITLGVVFGRAFTGNPFDSVEEVFVADDKAQALFDNCFEVIAGPDAPDVTLQELDQEVILYLTNDNILSNNFKEAYSLEDPSIPENIGSETLSLEDRSYVFQGYQIYQLVNEEVSPSDLNDVDKARLLFTTDIKDDISQIVNYELDPTIQFPVPIEKANGPNDGIRHSFQITEDQFALGDKRLVNYKTYYFMALAYGYNNYQAFDSQALVGQDEPYIASNKSAVGSLRIYSAIPHPAATENGGTLVQAKYGDGVEITQWEGIGNGENTLQLASGVEQEIMQEDDYRIDAVTFAAGQGPVDIRVIDPVRVKAADFQLFVAPHNAELYPDVPELPELDDEDADWLLVVNNTDSVPSDRFISIRNEQILTDYGIAITLQQYADFEDEDFAVLLNSSITYTVSSYPCYAGIPDADGFTELNWIRSGTTESEDAPETETIFDDFVGKDDSQAYEDVLGGTWAPYSLVAFSSEIELPNGDDEWFPRVAPTVDGIEGVISTFNNELVNGNNVDIVFTSNSDLWTRCAVLEMNPDVEFIQNEYQSEDVYDDEPKMWLRNHPSVDKRGRTVSEGAAASEATLGGAQPFGMGWFPGYAIDVNTGERLNMAFGEDSFLGTENGRDMVWNPTSRVQSATGFTYAGGQHWIYVFRNSQWYEDKTETPAERVAAYDEGASLYSLLSGFTNSDRTKAFRGCTWVGSALVNEDFPLLSIEEGIIPTDTRIQLRVATPYELRSPSVTADPEIQETWDEANNDWKPYYTFSTNGIAAQSESTDVLSELLDEINVVPNPYYGASDYERNKLQNLVKVTNLPEECTITIYTIGGNLIRQFRKSDPNTFVNWDLTNTKNIPIASGTYIIHVEVPGVGEKVLKWFGVIRPTDLDNF